MYAKLLVRWVSATWRMWGILRWQKIPHIRLLCGMNPTQQFFQEKAYERAGIIAKNWNPSEGFRANEVVLPFVYDYYQRIYFEQPDRFLWAGLARLTGGQVLFGLRNAVKIMDDPCVLTQEIVAVAKDIFESLAWQHELFLQDPETLENVCKALEDNPIHTHAYADCWQKMMSDDYETICLGNRMLLENEQRHTIQPHYETIRDDGYSNPFFRLTRWTMRNIHPKHRRFFWDMPLGDVTRFDDRWRWISHPRGMWPTWVRLPQKERDRLVALPLEAVIRHQW